MNARQGPRSRPSVVAPGGPGGADGLPDALWDAADRAQTRRDKAYADLEPVWCAPPCVLPYGHRAPCFTGDP